MSDGARATKRVALLRAVLVITALQALALVTYRQVEQRRAARSASAFRSERLSHAPSLPALELERADGQRVRTEPGRRVLLHFWATWCPPCREELPALLALARDVPELRVIALSLDDDWTVVRAFFAGAVPPEVMRDPGNTLRQRYEVGALPDTYLLEGGGALRFAGARAWDTREARAALERDVLQD